MSDNPTTPLWVLMVQECKYSDLEDIIGVFSSREAAILAGRMHGWDNYAIAPTILGEENILRFEWFETDARIARKAKKTIRDARVKALEEEIRKIKEETGGE